MKRFVYILLIVISLSELSCTEDKLEATFEGTYGFNILDYLEDNKDDFSSFISILKKSGIDKTLTAINPRGNGYTLFAPDNDAITRFIDKSPQFSSVDDILNDPEYVVAFSRFHVLNMKVRTNEFPFGAFSEPTLSGDYLTVSFIIEPDSSFYKINNQATVMKSNIETLNGFVHHIETALEPVTYTSYQLLEQNPEYSIFKEAVDLTGMKSVIDFNMKEIGNTLPVTVLVEPNVVYHKSGINSLDDLISIISPNNSDYTGTNNSLYNYVAYHFLDGGYYLDDFTDVNTNYNTFSDVPLNINGFGLDLAINKGREVFDTIVYQGDSTFIDYITFLYDESNIVTQSGAIHLIDQVMKQKMPSRALTRYQFREEPLLNSYYNLGGTFIIEDQEVLNRINWTTGDLFYTSKEEGSGATNNDYLLINGDFTISYTIPKIVQGKYEVTLRANSYNPLNALVEVFIDGKKIGGLVDLTSGGSATSPFRNVSLGVFEFQKYEEHEIEISTLIPGRFAWDWIEFKPY